MIPPIPQVWSIFPNIFSAQSINLFWKQINVPPDSSRQQYIFQNNQSNVVVLTRRITFSIKKLQSLYIRFSSVSLMGHPKNGSLEHSC